MLAAQALGMVSTMARRWDGVPGWHQAAIEQQLGGFSACFQPGTAVFDVALGSSSSSSKGWAAHCGKGHAAGAGRCYFLPHGWLGDHLMSVWVGGVGHRRSFGKGQQVTPAIFQCLFCAATACWLWPVMFGFKSCLCRLSRSGPSIDVGV